MRIKVADSVQLPCVVEGSVQHIYHEIKVPLHTMHLYLLPDHVLIQVAHIAHLVMVQPQQGQLVGLTMGPHGCYAHGIGANVHMLPSYQWHTMTSSSSFTL